jgi:hypothetical protein
LYHHRTHAASVGRGASENSCPTQDESSCVARPIGPSVCNTLDQRLEELGLLSLVEVIHDQQEQIKVQQQHILRLTSEVTTQQMLVESLQSNVTALLASTEMKPHLVGGRLPAVSEITRLRVQVFHSPGLQANDRKAKTEWTLRLTVWINGLRAAEEITCVRLYPPKRFSQIVHHLGGEVPTITMGLADLAADKDNDVGLFGMLQAKTFRKGTPYIRDQICYLQDYLTDDPEVVIAIGKDMIKITKFRPAAGTKEGRAKWWAEWSP